MSRSQSDFTNEQRGAVARAAVDYHMSARAVAAAAHAGELGVRSFKISPSTVSEFARKARAERDVEDRPGSHDDEMRERLDALSRELLSTAERIMDEQEDADELDLSRLRQVAGLMKTIRGTLALPGLGAGAGRASTGAAARLLVERLAAKAGSVQAANGDDNANAA